MRRRLFEGAVAILLLTGGCHDQERPRQDDAATTPADAAVAPLDASLTTDAGARPPRATILDWNETGAQGTKWQGWTWFTDASGFGEPGWRRNDHDQAWLMPRIHAKTDYGNRVSATIDPNDRAPSTASGAALKVYNVGGESTAAWWYLWRTNFGSQGLADGATNRLSFYFQAAGFSPRTWSADIDDYNTQFGTYLCWPGGAAGGEDCPKEAAGHHYYHNLTANPGTWLHVELDAHPQHKRSVGVPPNNPAAPRGYFQTMNSYYLEVFAGMAPQSYWVDEMELWQTAEPENDVSISSLWVGYWATTAKWEIGWNDGSFGANGYGETSNSTFEIRWSLSPISSANFPSATLVEPDYNELGATNRVRRPNSYKLPVWTRFSLPVAVRSGERVYFAVKDVSSKANGDGHDSPSLFVHTTDYAFR